MNRKIRVECPTEGFAERFARVLETCGFDAVGAASEAGAPDTVLIYEVRAEAAAAPAVPERDGEKRPYLIYSDTELAPEYLSMCKGSGLVGVIRNGTEPEEVAFLLNRALYYDKMLQRNPRAPVKIPVAVSSEAGTLKTIATQLSRDGMFIVTINPLAARSVCEIEFDVPGAGRTFKTGGRVVYRIEVNNDLSIISNPADSFKRLVAHPGMAVYFLDLPAEDRSYIDGYIETLL